MSKATKYTHMLVCSVTSHAVSRHTDDMEAFEAYKHINADADPVEIREYSEHYWKTMGP